ncbi:uroporphyrinogen-III synthase [Ktedonobacter robiniae]|uniref:Tetrapyrrole biosynthesis uroporphyrinogen III synthase domain-containing protein n=1 Tax=Ktedonobacter robiniae TaxID=2778365 RepID=A0ABQ3V2J5_9CHLR|nr:uroporphyrinogen-III synthase [Ktedonobacter robiniae]GHO58720.1 hypothetical protein KSB_71950 [Ktedonobacter robiniae]
MTLQHARIALLETRMAGEMANLLRRHGASNLVSVPAVREVARECGPQAAAFLARLSGGEIQMLVFFTGVGATALYSEAEKLGRHVELVEALRATTIVCRGPKPVAALKRYGIPVAASAPEPYTTHELLAVLAPFDLGSKVTGVVHYGEHNAQFTEELRQRGAKLEELCLYEWLLPTNLAPLRSLVKSIVAGEIDALAFTSQVQARHLFRIAQELQLSSQLTEALNTRTLVASIGPTCTGVLQRYGVTPRVIPEHPKMGHLVKALVSYLA